MIQEYKKNAVEAAWWLASVTDAVICVVLWGYSVINNNLYRGAELGQVAARTRTENWRLAAEKLNS